MIHGNEFIKLSERKGDYLMGESSSTDRVYLLSCSLKPTVNGMVEIYQYGNSLRLLGTNVFKLHSSLPSAPLKWSQYFMKWNLILHKLITSSHVCRSSPTILYNSYHCQNKEIHGIFICLPIWQSDYMMKSDTLIYAEHNF